MELSEWTDRLESISAGYGEVYGVERTPEWLLLKLGEEFGELTRAWLAASGQSRNRDRSATELAAAVTGEVADVVAMALVFAHTVGVDVDEALTGKWLPWEEYHRRRQAGEPAASPIPLDSSASAP